MKKPLCFCILTVILGFPVCCLYAQGYQAINGSPYAGSTGIFNNPAASIQSAYKWDLTLFSTQVKLSTNSLYLKNFTLSKNDSASLTLKDGFASRYIHSNIDLSLFNFLYKIDNNKAFTVGFRGRTYNHMKTQAFNYVDSTVNSFHSFLVANRNTSYIEGFITHAGWLEADLNYSQVLFESNTSKLSGGITLQIMKGLSGAFTKINKVSYLEEKNPNGTDTAYTFTNGSGSFGYSDNYDQSSAKEFLKNSKTAFGLSLGIEYLIYNPEMNNGTNTNLNYDWKIGVSLMDIGANSFKPSQYSSQFYAPNAAISDATMDTKLSGAANIKDFRDSLNTIFTTNTTLTNNFTISMPTRLIINVDKNLGNHVYVNGEMSMNFYSTSSYTKLRTRELNLLTITPRFETIGFGAYLPVQYNTQGQLWVGAALKLGPLLLGVHSLGIFKKDPTLNGGGYLLLSVHPFSKKKVLGKLDCPD